MEQLPPPAHRYMNAPTDHFAQAHVSEHATEGQAMYRDAQFHVPHANHPLGQTQLLPSVDPNQVPHGYSHYAVRS